MIKNLEVHNFKSIKDLKLDCKRFNIFIGEPNTGKSNILETLGFISYGNYGRYGSDLNEFVRMEVINNLFCDDNVESAVEVKLDDFAVKILFDGQVFKGEVQQGANGNVHQFGLNYRGNPSAWYSQDKPVFKFFRFALRKDFPIREPGFLLPPSGANLLAVLMSHNKIKSLMRDVFAPFGLKVVFKPQENKIEVLKQQDDNLILHPYSLTSDTLQRLVFYLVAVESNKDSVIAFEEPEAHAFPYYIKYLAEVIALNENNNQYFIATHNPYFLLSILEKAPKDDVAVFVTYVKDYETKVKALNDRQLQEIVDLETDVFFNIDRFLEDD